MLNLHRSRGAGDIVRAVDDVNGERHDERLHRDRAGDDRRRTTRGVH